ncbi:MAG: glycosyltransferase family 4 protein [Odoribacteraceae bacterium]|jgi:glycosyltransferase involved in cell wall biosynthesis|nr:glycosyltransferase family 4 protein [Odoribacteraceae bacterium]
MKKLKVAYFLGRLHRGGMETLLLDLLQQAGTASHEMMVIYREEGNMSPLFKATGARMFRLAARKGLDIRFLWRLRRLLRAEGVDVVHAQHPLEAAYAWLACLGAGVKVVETLHGYDFGLTGKGTRIMKWMLKRAHLNVFVSETQRAYYMKKYRLPDDGRQVVVYNGIHFAKIERRDDRESAPASPGCWSLGMVGSFGAVRDQMTVCRFLSRLKSSGISFRFLFAGNDDTPSGEACARYCRENGLEREVRFLGTRDDVPALLAGLDAFVYASRHDTFGIAVIEAIAAAIPVFVNDWEVMREVTGNGALAVLYKTGDAEDLYRHFLDFTTRPGFYREQARKAAARVTNLYSVEQHLSALSSHYSRICNR